MPIAETIGAVLIARTVGSIFNKVSEKIFPFEQSTAYKSSKQNERTQLLIQAKNADLQKELSQKSERLQKELLERNITNQRDIGYYNAMFARQTSIEMSAINAYNTLKHTMVQDVLRNFPLNISPLVLLENSNQSIDFLIGKKNNENIQGTSILDGIDRYKNNPSALSIFVMPLHIDSRINGKEMIAAQVWDTVYQDIESIFVNEYNRCSERPVIIYPTAWNKNAKPGLHASEMLYYFLHDLPTLVIEPRFDGKKLKVLFSCWGLGYETKQHLRQEISVDLDWGTIILPSAYERSKSALEILSEISTPSEKIKDSINKYRFNISLYEELKIEEKIKANKIAELDSLGDFSKLFYLDTSDLLEISKSITACLGMTFAGISDVHHLLATDVQPKLPELISQYFKTYTNQELFLSINDLYEKVKQKLYFDFPETKAIGMLTSKPMIATKKGDYAVENELKISNALIQKCNDLGYKAKSFEDAFSYFLTHCDFTKDELFIKMLSEQLSGLPNKKLYSKKLIQLINLK